MNEFGDDVHVRIASPGDLPVALRLVENHFQALRVTLEVKFSVALHLLLNPEVFLLVLADRQIQVEEVEVVELEVVRVEVRQGRFGIEDQTLDFH